MFVRDLLNSVCSGIAFVEGINVILPDGLYASGEKTLHVPPEMFRSWAENGATEPLIIVFGLVVYE